MIRRKRRHIRVFALASLGLLAVTTAGAHGQYTWNGPANGAWGTPANWLPVGVPGSGASATLGVGQGLYPCAADPTMSGISTLQIDNGTQLIGDIRTGNTNVINNGTIRLHGRFNGDTQRWIVSGATDLSGNGEVRLGVQACCGAPPIEILATSGSLLIGPNQLIHHDPVGGGGSIVGNINHQGTILADSPGGGITLDTTNGGWTNSGLVKSVNSSNLSITGTNPFVQTGGGQIVADGGSLALNGDPVNVPTLVGGVLDGRDPSNIQWAAFKLDGVTNVGLLRVNGFQAQLIGTSMTNSGVIDVQSTLKVKSNVTINGPGWVRYFGSGGVIDSDNGSTLTLGAQHMLRGAGQTRVRLVNNGTIYANVGFANLSLDTVSKTHNGLASAINNGILFVSVDVDGSGQWLADNSGRIRLWTNAHVTTTGQIEIKNNGRLEMEQNGATMTGSNLTMDGTGYLLVTVSTNSLTLSGNVDFAMTDETRWVWGSNNTLLMSGGVGESCPTANWAKLEAGGEDKGASLGGGGYSNNFDLSRLTIDAGAHVMLVDQRNNGNRGVLGYEVVYADVLTMNAGSVLNLNNLRMYVNGAQVLPGPRGGGVVINNTLTCNSSLGDTNCDTFVDLLDVPSFVQVLLDPAEYQLNYPGCLIGNADMNSDGVVNGLDAQGFVSRLLQP